jgi:hypothetical protein
MKPQKPVGNRFGFFSVVFNVAPIHYRLNGAIPVLLVEGDLRCPSVHYFSRATNLTAFSHEESEDTGEATKPTTVKGKELGKSLKYNLKLLVNKTSYK